MAAGTTNFPAYLQLNYQENGVNARFERDIQSMTQSAEQKFKASFSEITTIISRATNPSNFSELGKIDLGTSNFRQAAAEAKLYQESISTTIRTANALALETGDTSRETRKYIQALGAQKVEAGLAVQAADAQVASYTRLQAALDITADKSSRLAQAQRELYAEQAAAAKTELAERNSQSAFTQFAAPNISNSAVNNGATSSALAQRDALDDLRRAEVGAADGARILEAVQRETGLALIKTASSARDSAQAFIEADRAQQKLTGEASDLRAALDPMFAAQQRFDNELVRAERLYKQGAISSREYAQAQQLARNNIKAASAEIHNQGEAMVTQARRGTSAGGMVVNSLGSQRFAMIQVGQQLQDMTVGFASGQRTATIFAQQLPQLGFALTGFNGKLGQLGRLLAGPAGVAIFAAITVASFALTKAFESNGNAAEDAGLGAEDFARGIDIAKLSASEATTVLERLVDITRDLINVQEDYIDQNLRVAQSENLRIDAEIKSLDRKIQKEKEKDLGAIGNLIPFAGPDDILLAKLESNRSSLFAQRNSAGDARTNLEIAQSLREINEETDKGAALQGKYNRELQELVRLRKINLDDSIVPLAGAEAGINQSEFDQRARDLRSQFETDRESLRESQKSGRKKKGRSGRSAEERAAAAAARETSRLASLSDQASESIARINEQYDEQPRLIDRAAQATRKLDGIIDELSDPKNAGTPRLQQLISEAQQARALAANAVNIEIGRYAEENEQNLEILNLQAQGLFDQAEVLQEINRLDERLGLSEALETLTDQQIVAQGILEDEKSTNDEREAALDILRDTSDEMAKIEGQQAGIEQEVRNTQAATREYAEEIDRVTEALGDQLAAVDSIEQSLTSLLGGGVSGKDFIKDIRDVFSELQAKATFQSIFGDAFDEIEAELRKDTPLGKANARLVKEVDQTANSASEVATSLDFVAEAANAAAAKLQGIADPVAIGSPGAANDNQVLEVNGIQKPVDIEARSVSALADSIAEGIVGPLSGSLDEIFGTKFTQQLSGALSSALSGYLQGGEVGGVLGGLQGITKILGDEGAISEGIAKTLGDGFGSAIGGAGTGTQIAGLADALGLGGSFSTTGSQIGGAIGSVIPIPGGEIIGSIAGGFIGGLIGGSRRGSAIVTGADNQLGSYGNSSSRKEAAQGLGGSVQEGIRNIADALDADLQAFKVSIGVRNDDFRVDTQGRGYTKSSLAGVYDFGDDEAAAIAFAISDALSDGAITGIRASTQRLIQQAGVDLEAALQDALDFEDVFTRLRAYKDPVGAAIDALDDEFDNLLDIFGRAGASAQEYAELEELYGIERAQAVQEASQRITGSLQALFDDLTIGDSGLSLRSRLSNAQGAYDPLAQRVAAGDITAYDDYADAARNLLDLQREVYGSSEDYFRLLDEVTNLTKTRIDEETNIASLAVDRDTPFTIDQTPVVTAINYQTELLASYLAAISKNGTVTVDGGLAGSGRREPINRDVVNF